LGKSGKDEKISPSHIFSFFDLFFHAYTIKKSMGARQGLRKENMTYKVEIFLKEPAGLDLDGSPTRLLLCYENKYKK
jgi:hypothetical protein